MINRLLASIFIVEYGYIKMTDRAIKILEEGGVAVLKTDTLYGVVGQALVKNTVERIYKLKKRNNNKPLIILISSLKDLERFGIIISEKLKREIMDNFWPGPVSIILPCSLEKFEYLHRGQKTLAFRLPKNKALIKILKKTGPLVAPSANPEGLPPAQNIDEAKKYFGSDVDFYLKGTKSKSKSSTIIKINENSTEVIRG